MRTRAYSARLRGQLSSNVRHHNSPKGDAIDFYTHFNDAQRLADSIDDWDDESFNWSKAYVAATFAAVAYEEVPQFELKKSKRAKVIPCDRYQAHVARWETEQRRATVRDLDTSTQIEVLVQGKLVITISRLRKVIFVSFRGTTISFSDFKADLDIRKVRYQSGFGETVSSPVKQTVDS